MEPSQDSHRRLDGNRISTNVAAVFGLNALFVMPFVGLALLFQRAAPTAREK